MNLPLFVDFIYRYTFVSVYSYPDMQFKTLMKDTRTGPAGSLECI